MSRSSLKMPANPFAALVNEDSDGEGDAPVVKSKAPAQKKEAKKAPKAAAGKSLALMRRESWLE